MLEGVNSGEGRGEELRCEEEVLSCLVKSGDDRGRSELVEEGVQSCVVCSGATAKCGGWWLGGSELAGHAGTLLLWLLFDCGYCCLFAELYPMLIF